jgi:L-asparaginase
MTIKVFVTGGTIDNLEYAKNEDAPRHKRTVVPSLLKQGRATVEYGVEVILFKDSKFITESDRELVYSKCKQCKENKIVITHGTMTMASTAKYLSEKKLKKTIVLTGSALLSKHKTSDALFNLGSAIIAVQMLPIGVFVIMNGRVFPGENAKKNLKTGFFENKG